MIHLLNNFYAVQIPEGAHKFQVVNEYGILWYELPPMRGFLSIELEPGSWSIVSTSEEMTEEQMSQIVEMQKTFGYRDYMAINGSYQWTGLKQSFQSLLKSKGLEGRQLILKLEA